MAAAVVHREALVVEEIEHKKVLVAGHKVVVAHRVGSAVDRGNFGMEVAFHIDSVVTALKARFHSWCKIAGLR